MQRQTSPKAAQGGTDFAMLPSAHRKPERRDSKAFKMETQFNTGRAWFLSVALLLGTLGFVFVAGRNQPVAAPTIARMTARPTEKDVQEAERLQKVMAGAD